MLTDSALTPNMYSVKSNAWPSQLRLDSKIYDRSHAHTMPVVGDWRGDLLGEVVIYWLGDLLGEVVGSEYGADHIPSIPNHTYASHLS